MHSHHCLAILVLATTTSHPAQSATTCGRPEELAEEAQVLKFWGEPGMALSTTLKLENTEVLLDLEVRSLRSPDLEVILVDDDGPNLWQGVPPVSTYRGALRDASTAAPCGHAWVAVQDGEMQGVLQLDDGRLFTVEPVNRRSPDVGSAHVVRAVADIPLVHSLQDFCQVAKAVAPSNSGTRVSTPPPTVFAAGSPLRIVELALDLDFPQFQLHGQNVNTAFQDMENLFNVISGIYERDIGVTFEFSAVLIRTTAVADPYTANDAPTLLNQFESEWINNRGPVIRDVAHLMTGRTLSLAIGRAEFNSVCNKQLGYGLSQTLFFSNLAHRAALTGHELGHNFNAVHCDADTDCNIMCSVSLGCTGIFNAFGSRSIALMTAARDAFNCLSDQLAPPALPIFDDFESNSFDPAIWSFVRRANIRKGGVAEPSGEYSLEINSTGTQSYQHDDARTNFIDLSNHSSMHVSFFVEQSGPETGETLEVEYYSSSRLWRSLVSIVSDGTVHTSYNFHRHAVPADGLWNEFRLRFRSNGNEANDKWFVDNVRISNDLSHVASDLLAGTTGVFSTYGAQPGEQVFVLYSLSGTGSGPCLWGGSMCLDLVGNLFLLSVATADATGATHFPINIVNGIPPTAIWTQALAIRGPAGATSVKSNVAHRVSS